MAQHNLGTVVSFEFIRTVTKRRFWIGTLAVPVVMAVVFLLVFVSSSTTDRAAEAIKDAQFSIAYTDGSGLVTAAVAAEFGAVPAAGAAAGIEAVKNGAAEAYFDFPADPVQQSIHVYGVDQGIFQNGRYAAVAQEMLHRAVEQQIGSQRLAGLARGTAAVETTTFQGSAEAGGINSVIPPLFFLLVFYGLVILLAGQMLNSTLEEKENRVTEMILTTLRPTTLITGKVIALFMVGIVQVAVFASPAALAYLFFRSQLNIPSFDLSRLIFDPGRMLAGFLILAGGFALFTTTLVAVGAAMPTAKDAGSFMGTMMALIFIPIYAVTLVVSDPQALIVQIFTYFPYSAPVTALLRNGFGSLNPAEATAVVLILFGCAAVMLRTAVRLFQYGSIEYSRKVPLRTVFATRSGTAPVQHDAG